MIILSIITLIISFLMQGITSNYIGYHPSNLSWFLTIYPLITLLILTPHFEDNKKILILVIIFGLLTDIVYTNTPVLNTCIFIAVYNISKYFHFIFPYNLLTINISNLLSIFTYHIISFLFLYIIKYDNYTIQTLLKILSHSIIMTIIYTSILYLIIESITKKFELKEIK